MIRFLVFSDLHYDEAADGDERINEILTCAKERTIDFIVSLGDLCKPIDANKGILKKINSLGIPFYSVIGNHETDNCQLSEILSFFSMKSPYYSVVYKEYKLIFLNTCYLNQDGKETAFYQRNHKQLNVIYPIIPLEEIQWLKNELSSEKKYIIFSHHSLVNNFVNRGVYNRADIRELFKDQEVLLCLNGHDHGDSYSVVDYIPYYTVNSANYTWVGTQIASSDILSKKYSYLNGILQYKQALNAYIEIADEEIRIEGMTGDYLSVTPDDIGLHDYMWNGVSIKPQTSSLFVNRKRG